MNADTLRTLVADYFAHHAASFHLDPDTVAVEYVLNWGGFGNYSYRIRDARHAYHLKLRPSAEDQTALHRWRALAPILEQYHAPPILEWIDLGSFAGPLFPSLPGQPPTLTGEVVDEIVPLLGRLSADRKLAAILSQAEAPTARSTYLATFHDRFTEDLRGIREARPPFVSEELVRWMDEQVALLSKHVSDSAAFDERLTKPVHGDLWLNNVLWVSRDEWHLVDWDDIRIGDPAADLAALLGPTADDVRPLKLLERVDGQFSPTERERLPLLGRATLLDWVIDPLSDWIDAGAAPEHLEVVRAEKERIHEQAFACYKELFVPGPSAR